MNEDWGLWRKKWGNTFVDFVCARAFIIYFKLDFLFQVMEISMQE